MGRLHPILTQHKARACLSNTQPPCASVTGTPGTGQAGSSRQDPKCGGAQGGGIQVWTERVLGQTVWVQAAQGAGVRASGCTETHWGVPGAMGLCGGFQVKVVGAWESGTW